MILLDTNVISELVKPTPNPAVVAFLRRTIPETMFTSTVCEAEMRYGLARLPPGRRKADLTKRIAAFFADSFSERILHFDHASAEVYGELRAVRDAAGRPISVQDAMIAATASAYGTAIATRNVGDFVGCGVEIVDPWQPVDL